MNGRGCGILLPVFSLPSPYGIGTLGKEAFAFIDFLERAGQKYWQILPVGPTSYGDSPYQSYSIYAGNPYFIDLDILKEEGLLKQEELPEKEEVSNIDYAELYHTRFGILQKAFERFDVKSRGFAGFLKEESHWIKDYGLFMSLKDANEGKSWNLWTRELRDRTEEGMAAAAKKYEKEILFWEFVQYEFFRQWRAVKEYANQKGIRIIGDIPIYVAYDSVDVWAQPEYYELDEEKNPINVAGCPPDGFSATGQLWGNPLYNWARMEEEDFAWWVRRLDSATTLYDVVRIDHFRGFESYFSISFGSATAQGGVWRKGPGIRLFQEVEKKLGKRELIAEDLGYLTPEVEQLLKDSGYPGMKLLQFAFDSREAGNYLPHNYGKNSVVYIGTHDNDTVLGWMDALSHGDFKRMLDYLNLDSDKDIVWKLIRIALGTVCDTAVLMMQDLLDLRRDARINTPSTLGGNWTWRAPKEAFSDDLADKLRDAVSVYERI